MSSLISMERIFSSINAPRDVAECLIKMFCQNTKKSVRKYFSPRERPLTLQLLDKLK